MQRPTPHWTLVAGAVISVLVPAAMAAAAVPAQSGTVDLATQSAATMRGAAAGDSAGTAVGMAGDVNGDGIGDVVVGAPTAAPGGVMGAGSSYVVFGPVPRAGIDLGALGTRGFRMDGVAMSDQSGQAVAGAGDVNGDGYADVIVGAPTSLMGRGHAYLVFGGKATANVDLGALGSRGFTITGPTAPGEAGWTVAGVGDVNGDRIDDVAVGAILENTGSGAAYVIYGSRSPVDVDLNALGARGFRIAKASSPMFDEVGWSLGGAGDVNGDGYADVAVGSPYFGFGAASGFVIFGGPTNAGVDLLALGSGGLVVNGASSLAASASGVGDVNGDGRADVAFGAPSAAGGNGMTYVIYGSSASGTLDVSTMPTSRGFAIEGAMAESIGTSVAAAGDVNGDGIADLVTGADQANGSAGRAYVVYGSRAPTDLLLGSLAPAAGFRMDGAAASDMAGRAVSGGSDVTGDGRPDVLVGAPQVAAIAGIAYVVGGFGTPSVTYPAPVTGQVGTAITSVTPKVARTGSAVFTASPALPAGLTLDSSTGTISGTPTAAATGTFTITMTDDVGTATATEQVQVTGTGGASGAGTAAKLHVQWAIRGASVAAVITRVPRATSYRLLARAGGARRTGRCIVPARQTAPVTCAVALTTGRWTLTAVAGTGSTVVGTARRRVTIGSAAIRVTG